MKWLHVPLFCLLMAGNHSFAQTLRGSQNKVMGVFDGRTPCNILASYLNEPVMPECIKIKWRLTLFVDSISNEPTTYEMIGFTYKKGNPRVGNWQIITGTLSNPQAIVYQLNEKGREPLLLQRVNNNILLFLDKEKSILVGNGDFSYSLNRVAK